jgi:hypothetical protein
MLRSVILAVAVSASACALFAPRQPDPLPNYDANDACAVACEALRSLHCPEGQGNAISGELCTVICVRSIALRPLPLGCWSRAQDVVAARSCGSLRCVQ